MAKDRLFIIVVFILVFLFLLSIAGNISDIVMFRHDKIDIQDDKTENLLKELNITPQEARYYKIIDE